MTIAGFGQIDKIYKVLNPVLLNVSTEGSEPKRVVLPRGSLVYLTVDGPYRDLFNNQGAFIGRMWYEDLKALNQYLKFEE